MAEATTDQNAQASIELPNGMTFTGMGGDVEAMREQIEERHDEQAEAAPVQPVEAKAPAAEPKLTRGQKRFAELTREREDATRRAETAEARIKELETAVPVTTAPVVTPPQAERAVAIVAARTEPTPAIRPKPTEAEVGTKYAQYADFIEDLSDWKAERLRAELQTDFDARLTARIEADRASRSLSTHVQTVFEQGRKAFHDFDAVLAKNPRPIPPLHQQAILSAPNPEQLMYALAQDDPKLMEIIAIADPIRLGFALASIAPRAAVATPATTAPAVRTTNAPAPPQPVGAGTRTAKPSLQELIDSGDIEGYQAARAAGQVH